MCAEQIITNKDAGEHESRDVGQGSGKSLTSPAKSPLGERYVKRLDPIQSDRAVGHKTETNVVDHNGNPTLPGAVINTHFMPVTTYIYDDEAAIRYREIDLTGVGWRGLHRFRVVEVVRNDALAEYWEDMGESSTIKGRPIHLIGGEGTIIIETFANLKAIADEERDRLWPDQTLTVEEFNDYRLGKSKRIL